MAAVFHTPITPGAPGDAATVNTPLLAIDTKLQISLNSDGTIKTDAVDTAQIAAAAVGAAELAAAVAGSGLAGGAGTALSVNVDGATIQITGDTLGIPDGGVTGPKLATTLFPAGANLLFDPTNKHIQVGHNFDGRTRWLNASSISIAADAANPYGSGYTMTHLGTGATTAGKYTYLDEAALQAGDIVHGSALLTGTTGNYILTLRAFDAANSILDSETTAFTMASADQFISTPALTIPATTHYLILFTTRSTGSADMKWYGAHIGKGDYANVFVAPESAELFGHTQRQPGNLIDFPFNEAPHLLGVDWGGLARWVSPVPASDASIIINDPDNPSGGNSFVSGTGIQAGVKIHMKEKGIKVGDTVTISALISSASAGSGTLKARYIKSDGSVCSDTSPISTSRTITFPTTTPQRATVTLTSIPSDATQIWIWVARVAGTPTIKVFEWWASIGRIAGPRATPAFSSYAQQSAIQAGMNLAQLNEAGLRQWHAKVARLNALLQPWHGAWTDVSKVQPTIAFLGHSWVARKGLFAALATYLRAEYGDGGNGWVSAASANSNNVLYGATWSRLGTWTDGDAYSGLGQDLTVRGLDLMQATSVDDATPASITIASSSTVNTAFVIHYIKKVNGGSFRYQVDGGAWTTVNTANGTEIAATVTISGLADTTHTLVMELTAAGVAGVTILGVDLQRTGTNGIRLHKLGNGSTHTAEWAGVDATIWQAQLTTIDPDLIPILCLTNDRSGNVVPTTTAANLSILIDRCRVAAPYADILLITDGATGDSATYGMDAYDAAVRDLAVRQGTAFLSGYELMHPYASNKARHLLTPDSGANDPVTNDAADDGRHLTSIGEQLLASAMFKMLRVD